MSLDQLCNVGEKKTTQLVLEEMMSRVGENEPCLYTCSSVSLDKIKLTVALLDALYI